MARSRKSKESTLTRLGEAIEESISVVFASVRGLTVHELEELRQALRAEESVCMVAKKTLLSRAFLQYGTTIDFRSMDGEVAAVFGYADQVAPARALSVFGKQHERLTILAGLLKDDRSILQVVTASTVNALALLPSRDELRARVVGTIAAPLRNCVGVIQAPLRAFVQVLNAYSQTK